MNPVYSNNTAPINHSFYGKMCEDKVKQLNKKCHLYINSSKSRSRTPPPLNLTNPYSISSSYETQQLQKYQQQQHSLLHAMQQQHAKDKQKLVYLRKLKYMKMTMHEQVYRSQLQLLRSISSTSSNDSPMNHKMSYQTKTSNDEYDIDNVRYLDLIENNNIDPIIKRHMSIPITKKSSNLRLCGI